MKKREGPQPGAGTDAGSKRKTLLKQIILLSVVTVLVLIVLVSALKTNYFGFGTGCTNDRSQYYTGAVKSIDKGDFAKQAQLIKDIQNSKRYITSPNCVYALIELNRASGNYAEVKRYETSFEALPDIKQTKLHSTFKSFGVSTGQDAILRTRKFVNYEQNSNLNFVGF